MFGKNKVELEGVEVWSVFLCVEEKKMSWKSSIYRGREIMGADISGENEIIDIESHAIFYL